MHPESKTRAIAGLVAVIAGVVLIGTSGIAFVAGWALWATGLGALLTALPTAGEDGGRRSAAVSVLSPSAGAVSESRAA
jgi:hypothetical protein